MALGVFMGSLFALLPLGIPIAFILLMCSVALMLHLNIFDTVIISQQVIAGANRFSLMAIPFFMLAGQIMARGGLSTRIVNFANICVGNIRGGMGYTAILACILFSGLSGSPIADTAALGAILIPMMVEKGYPRATATAIICAGTIVSALIPPSVPMIVLGSTVGVSIGRLFMAGLIPGLLVGVALLISWWIVVRVKDIHDVAPTYTREEKMNIIKESLPAMGMPVLIIGGIRLGIFTPTEAGAFACVYALVVSAVLYKELKFADIIDIGVVTGRNTSIVMIIVGAATAIGWLITVGQIPAQTMHLLGDFAHNQLLLLLVINFFFIVAGMVIDLTPKILIFGPVVFPVIIAAGINPVYFGVIMIYNLTVSLITPPVGTSLFLGCSVGKTNFAALLKALVPFLICHFGMLLLFILFPMLVLVPMGWF